MDTDRNKKATSPLADLFQVARRVVWLSGLRIDALDDDQFDSLIASVRAQVPSAILISGDTADAPTLIPALRRLESGFHTPIYFVLGGHDFYLGSIESLRHEIAILSRYSDWLRYLPVAGVIELNQHTALVGHDGWGDDARDYELIYEFRGRTAPEIASRSARLIDEAVRHAKWALSVAFTSHAHVIFVTHTPPFQENPRKGWGANNTPQFVPNALGVALLEIMRERPEQALTVFCGSSPVPTLDLADNLTVYCGSGAGAQIERVFEVD